MIISEAINEKSRDCGGETRVFCKLSDCALFDFCTKQQKRKSMIRKYCFQCMNRQPREIKLCTAEQCPFYSFRMG
jgi:hypothetical protein